MPRGRGGSKGYGKGKTWTRPDPGDRFPKFSLAPYGMSNGSPFYLQGSDEKKLLSLKHIAESRQPRNSEAVCLRLGLQLSESASTMEMGAAALAQLAEDDPKSSHWKCFEDMTKYLASSKGQEMLAAAKVLNKGNGGPKDEREMSSAIETWLHGLERLLQKEKSVRKMAQLSARMYLWSMDTLEQLAMYQHPDVFFDHIDDNNELLAIHALEKFAKAPSVKTLRKAMEAAYNKQVLSKTVAKEKDALSSSEDASPPVARRGRKRKDSSSSESKETSEKKPKGRSGKKEAKERKKRAAAEKEAARKKRKSAEKKTKPGSASKLARHRSSSGASDMDSSERPDKVTDKWSETSSDDGSQAFTTWGGAPIQAFLDAMADGALARTERLKQKRLQLPGLLNILNMIPADLLKPYKLETVLTMLQKMERLPRKEKVDEIFSLLNALAEVAASHLPEVRPADGETPPDPDAAAAGEAADGEAAADGAAAPGDS